MDLKGGLEGVRGKPGHQGPGKQSWAGRDPRNVDQRSNLSLFGEAVVRKDSKEAGGQRCEETGRGREGRLEAQEQRIAASGPRPRQGKVIASLKEAFEGQVARGGGRRRKRS